MSCSHTNLLKQTKRNPYGFNCINRLILKTMIFFNANRHCRGVLTRDFKKNRFDDLNRRQKSSFKATYTRVRDTWQSLKTNITEITKIHSRSRNYSELRGIVERYITTVLSENETAVFARGDIVLYFSRLAVPETKRRPPFYVWSRRGKNVVQKRNRTHLIIDTIVIHERHVETDTGRGHVFENATASIF